MSRRIDSRRQFSRLLIAIALSLSVHAGLLLWARWHAPKLPPRATAPAPTEIEIYPTVPQAVRPSQRSSTPAKVGAAPHGSSNKSLEGKRGLPPAGHDTVAELAGSDAPRMARDGGTAPDLLPHLHPSLMGSISPQPEEPIIEGLSGLHAPLVSRDLVGATVAGVLGRERVASGNVDPYFSRLRDTLTEIWNTSRQQKKVLQPTSIRITQARSGHLVSAELISASNDAGWDRGLLADLKQAAHRFPEPPAEVFSGHAHLSSLWSFQYAPRALTDFDVVDLFDKKAIGKSTGKRIQLLGVESSD
jgi:hypothetical protein